MDYFLQAQTFLAIFPPILAIVLAVITRRVLLSLGVGIVCGALFAANFHTVDASGLIFSKLVGLFFEEGSLNAWNLYILGFLLLLGVLTALMSASGSAIAFAAWIQQKIKTRREAEFFTLTLGFLIFIDDYFNSLVVGSISQPVTDKLSISRAKLAYLLDSTASPICVLMPISSWGAYIAAILMGLFSFHDAQSVNSMQLMLTLLPYNFYPIFALLLLILVVYYRLDLGPMKKEEALARQGQLFDPKKGVPAGVNEKEPSISCGHIYGLVLPVSVMMVTTFITMIITGFINVQQLAIAPTIFTVLEHLDLGLSLFSGALAGTMVAVVIALMHGLKHQDLLVATTAGAKSMMPAVLILLFAWMMAAIINELSTGKVLADLAFAIVVPSMIPAILFVLAGFVSFATGSSWGTFGIMLPIAFDMGFGISGDPLATYPYLAAVLSGAVFGDHCSPISDTTILSSTGAGCHHMDHVVTQLPYALIGAFIALLGFISLGVTNSLPLSLGFCCAGLIMSVFMMKSFGKASGASELASGS